MSQVYDEDNNLVPVTIIEAGPCPILQAKSHEKDGYVAIQIGFNPKGKAPNNPNKCQVGIASKVNVEPQHLHQEIRLKGEHSFEQGSSLSVENFSDVKVVDVISTTKGKGFQGVVKDGILVAVQLSHGSMFHRRGGSYGLCQWPGRVFKEQKDAWAYWYCQTNNPESTISKNSA